MDVNESGGLSFDELNAGLKIYAQVHVYTLSFPTPYTLHPQDLRAGTRVHVERP